VKNGVFCANFDYEIISIGQKGKVLLANQTAINELGKSV
jgi:hypothetical protein